ncbi:MAG: HNH endonuclease [Acinetobacter sp.]|jgi:predicted HNH restriction endonuclease|uniref:HNH endonuclease n=1 Tax=Acinetobacter sp. TaxID=472 RepID=UPI0025C4628D|nr:HNH endonuclease [Acinetobacter sp.]
MSAFKKAEVFILIGQIIDNTLLIQDSIHRNQIAAQLIEKYPELIQNIATGYKNQNLTYVSGNLVDWFSAELTKKSSISKDWQNKYRQEREKVGKREVTVYKSLYSFPLEEMIPLDSIAQLTEGNLKTIAVNAFERNPVARRQCLEHYGVSCQCCNFNFYNIYGELGQNYIHVHHIIPLAKIRKNYQVDPTKDLIPLCANCHAMIHRRNPPLSIEELKEIIKSSHLP